MMRLAPPEPLLAKASSARKPRRLPRASSPQEKPGSRPRVRPVSAQFAETARPFRPVALASQGDLPDMVCLALLAKGVDRDDLRFAFMRGLRTLRHFGCILACRPGFRQTRRLGQGFQNAHGRRL